MRIERLLRSVIAGALVCTSPALAEDHRAEVSAPPSADETPDGSAHPIDCPLHKGGLDPRGMRPFAETEKWIEYLDSPERASWQKPEDVVRALSLKGTETVADVGAGSGYFTFRLSRAVPKGKVFATDVDPEMVRHIHRKVMTERISNVEVALARSNDPAIPPGTNVALVCDVIHHVADRHAWLKKGFDELTPGGRLVVIEFKEGRLPQGPPESVKIPKARLIAMVEDAGFRLVADDPKLLPYQTFLTFEKPSAAVLPTSR
jgi:ubiquinone/menaquinone biosynthesis C-methylase UbiE